MRHPFWKWAGWLGVSLAGCLHGQDSRQVLTRPVADHQESRRSITVGPRQLNRESTKSVAKSARDQNVGTEAANKQHEAARDPHSIAGENLDLPQAAQLIPTKYVPPPAPTSESMPAPAPTQPMPLQEPARFVPASTTTGKPAIRAVGSSERRPFAEFERAVPVRGSRNAESSATVSEPQRPGADKVESLSSPTEEKHRASRQTKELSDVANSATTIHATEPMTRTRDVAQLVEQVFEDLRQHRLTEARERTEQLKRLVARRSTAESMDVTADIPAQTANGAVDHPAETQLSENRNESPGGAANESAQPTGNSENESFLNDEVPTHE